MEPLNEKVWYAMRATYGRNMSAKLIADHVGITSYIPMHYTVIHTGGGKCRKYVPVIRDIIFVYASKEEIKELKRRISYLQYITRPIDKRNTPIIVPEMEMRKFIDITLSRDKSLIYLNPDEINIHEGSRIKIHGGEFDGYEGYFIKLKGKRKKRLVVSIDNLIAAAIEITPDFIEVIED